VRGAPARLNPGGAIWIEHGWTQAQAVREFLRQAGFTRVASLQDLAGIERISGGYL
ncbi:MAG: protein-(glutamine-N5) methyltransferase, release factor-specific, partial [Comamonadaceae bacterium]